MARPLKQGLDYFPHDTDAVNDEKIEALRALYGNDGYTFYFILLERIYRAPAAELDVSAAETLQILASKVGVTTELFGKMLQTALDRGCFDKAQYADRGVLTSDGIKRRAGVVFEKRDQMRQRYEPKSVPGVGVSDAETAVPGVVSSPISDAETSHSEEVSAAEIQPETAQSKGKKSKGKKSKEEDSKVMQDQRSPAPPSPETERIVRVEVKLEELRGYESPSFAAERKAIKAMLKTYEPEEICACYLDLKRQDYWAAIPLPMMSLAKQIGEWQTNIRKVIPPPKPRRKWTGVEDPRAIEIWEQVKPALQEQVNKANYETWLKDTVGLSYTGSEFVVGTPKAFAVAWLEDRLHSLVRGTLMKVVGQDIELVFEQVDAQFLDTLASLTPGQRHIITEALPGEPGYGETQAEAEAMAGQEG